MPRGYPVGAELRSLRRRYAQTRESAKRRGINFDLDFSLASALFLGDCSYCGSPASEAKPVTQAGKPCPTIPLNGIDRADNAEGYTEGNCASCCQRCNGFKGTLSAEDFINHCKKIVQWQTSA